MLFLYYCYIRRYKQNLIMNKDIVVKRVEMFRSYMCEKGLDAFVVVSSDPHSSEYVADRWKAREWLSGFDGSAGTVVITADKALLWTDSRYWLAAEKLLDGTGFELMKDGLAETPSITEWLLSSLERGNVVGVDATVCSVVEVNAWRSPLASAGIKVEFVNDPFDALWKERPSVPLSVAQIMPQDIVGESAASKIARLRETFGKEGVDGMVVTMLDEVAWITNLRGNDVEYNPVLVSYMLITDDNAVLYIDERKLTDDVKAYLQSQGISVAPYSDIWQALKDYDKATLLMQPNRCNAAVYFAVGEKAVLRESPIALMKAVKNEVEIEGFERAMLSEGVAMVKLLKWLKPAVEKGGVTELDVDAKLTELRSADPAFRGLSFATIAAWIRSAAWITEQEPFHERTVSDRLRRGHSRLPPAGGPDPRQHQKRRHGKRHAAAHRPGSGRTTGPGAGHGEAGLRRAGQGGTGPAGAGPGHLRVLPPRGLRKPQGAGHERHRPDAAGAGGDELLHDRDADLSGPEAAPA